VSLANELLKNFEPEIESITLIPSQGGRFEVSVNGKLIYSKLQTQRHAEPGEVVGLARKILKSSKSQVDIKLTGQ
jgi:selenoprotein W-related protein